MESLVSLTCSEPGCMQFPLAHRLDLAGRSSPGSNRRTHGRHELHAHYRPFATTPKKSPMPWSTRRENRGTPPPSLPKAARSEWMSPAMSTPDTGSGFAKHSCAASRNATSLPV